MLDGDSGDAQTGHFKCSVDSKYIGELQLVMLYVP